MILAYSSLLLLGLCDNIRGPLYPEILNSFSVNNSKGSWFFTLSSLCGIFGAYTSRYLIDKRSLMGSLRIAIIFLLGGQIIFALATQFLALLLGTVFFGFSIGLMGVIQNTLVVQEMPEGPMKRKVISGLHSMYAASSLAAPMLIGLLSQFHFEYDLWRVTFIFGAGFCLLTLGLSYFLKSIGSELRSWSPSKQFLEDKIHSEASSSEIKKQIYFAFILASYVLAEILVSSRVALYVRRELQGSLSDSNYFTAMFFVGLFSSRLLFSLWSPQISTEKQLRVSLLFSVLSLLCGLYIHPLGFSLSGLFMGPFYPLMMLELGKLFKNQIKEAISWAVTFSSLLVVFMHFFVGLVTDYFGVKVAFLLGPLFVFIAFVMLENYEKVFRRL